ncbi:MAG: HlyD family efflux transporter periplasmic adaptor subunit [Gammaproteobacteria bacterium]|jgi:multidrug resistance efflux pump
MDTNVAPLRTDLKILRRETAEGVAFVIKDPARDEFFHLREVEAFIAEQLSRETSLASLKARVEAHFDAELPDEMLAAFVKTLDRNGLLENDRGTRAKAPQKKSRLAGNALYFRIRLFNPARLLDWLQAHTRFFFTRAFVVISTLTIIASILVAFFNRYGIANDAMQLYRVSTLPFLVATVFIVGTAHELSHGLTCRHFGGEVRDMGFLMLYFQPALYCNVSDAWMFPEKSHRLWVGLAGPFFELFLGASATLIWRLTATDVWIHQFCLLVMATAGLKTLLNFNPLIKLDGYYLLSDYLEIPNLRKKAFAHLGDMLRRLVGKPAILPEVSRRERKIFLAYGLAGLIGSLAIFTYSSFLIAEYLVIDQQRVIFSLFVSLVGVRYRQYFKRLFGHVKKHYGDKKPLNWPPKFKRSTLIKAGIAGLAGLLLVEGHMQLTVSGPIRVLPHRNADVRTKINGIISEVLVHEGEHVSRGQVIARLSDQARRADLLQTIASIKQKKANLEQLLAGPTKHQIQVARQEVENWQDQIKFAQSKRIRIETLFKQHLASHTDYDAARELETKARNQLDEARGKLRVLLDGARPEEIEGARAELSGLEARRDFLEDQLKKVNIVSPATGVVTTPTRQLKELVNQAIPEGGLIAKVYDVSVVTVETAISEKEVAAVKLGQKIGVKVRAFPDRTFYGTVIEIGTTTEHQTSDSASTPTTQANVGGIGLSDGTATVRVVTEISNEDGLLKPGMTGMAKVYCGERSVMQLMMRRLSRTVRVEFWSWW